MADGRVFRMGDPGFLHIVLHSGVRLHIKYDDLRDPAAHQGMPCYSVAAYGLVLHYANGERRTLPWSAVADVIEGQRLPVVAPMPGPTPSTAADDVPQGHEHQPEGNKIQLSEQPPAEHVRGEDDRGDDEQDDAHSPAIPRPLMPQTRVSVETALGYAKRLIQRAPPLPPSSWENDALGVLGVLVEWLEWYQWAALTEPRRARTQ